MIHNYTSLKMTTSTLVCLLLPLASLLFQTNHHVTALPTGAAACPANVAAVQGSHISTTRTITTGTLRDGNLQMTLVAPGTETPLSLDSPTDFAINQDYTLQLKTTDNTFRGFLFRLGPPAVVVEEETEEPVNGTTTATATTSSMEDADVVETQESLRVSTDDDVNVQLARTVCITNEQVGGLTHANSLEKQTATGILRMDEIAAGLVLDVTVVVRNQGTESEYYYTQYTLNAVEGINGDNNGENSSSTRWNVPSIWLSSIAALVGYGLTLRR